MPNMDFSQSEYCAAFLIDFLASIGVTSAELSFSGGGDSGDVDSVTFEHRSGRAPAREKIAETWRLAVARHYLLFPEYTLDCFKVDGAEPVKLEELVEGYFYKYIDGNLGDWVNNEGGGGTVEIRVAERMIDYAVHYNTDHSSEPIEGTVENPEVFGGILAAAKEFGIAEISSDFEFGSEGECWSHDVKLTRPDGTEAALEDADWTALARKGWDLLQSRGLGEDADLARGDFREMMEAVYHAFVESEAESLSDNGTEGWSVSLTISAEDGPAATLGWSGYYRYMDSDDGDGGEIEAPQIGAKLKSARRRKAA